MTTLGLIIGNRGFFPAHLCESGRRDILRVLEEEGIKAVTLPVEASRFGAVESLVDAHKCADLFSGLIHLHHLVKIGIDPTILSAHKENNDGRRGCRKQFS